MSDPTDDVPPARGLLQFARENKAYWIVPMVVVALLLLAAIVLTATPFSPFIYRLF